MKTAVLVDDHDDFRLALGKLIGKRTGFEVVGEGADARQGEEAIRSHKPDIAVIDLSLPDRSGIQLTRLIRESVPGTGIVIVSMHSKIDYIVGALRAGARGYLVKESVSACIAPALEAVAAGEYYLDSALSGEIVTRLLETPSMVHCSDPGYASLTAREQEIFCLLAQGNSTWDIADKLCISAKTVSNHRTNILGKMEFHSTADLIRYAAKLGLLGDSV